MAAPDEYCPPRRLRHVRAFVVRHVALPPEAGGSGGGSSSGCAALEREVFLSLHCLGGSGSGGGAERLPEGGAGAAHVTAGSVGTAQPEWACPAVGALAPHGAPPDAPRLLLTLRHRSVASADVAGGDAGALLSRCVVDLSSLRPVPDADAPWLPPNAVLLRLEDGCLYAPAQLAPPPDADAQPSEASAAAAHNGAAPGLQRAPAGAPRRIAWADARWDFQRLLGCRAAVARAAAAREAAAAAAAAALGAAAERGRVQTVRDAAEARLRAAQERRRVVHSRTAALSAAAAAASVTLDGRAAALDLARTALARRQTELADARAALAAPGGRRAALSAALRALCHERWLKVRDLWQIYPVRPASSPAAASSAAEPLSSLPPPGVALSPPLARGAGGAGAWDARLAAANGGAAAAALAVAGVPLEALRANALPAEAPARERAAAALGYVAAAVALLELILAVPLRYGVVPRGSRSVLCDRADAGATGAAPRTWHPLYTDGVADRARFVQAVLLLNRDLEQLLNAFGLPAVGPRHTAANLARLCAPALRPRLPPPQEHGRARPLNGDKADAPLQPPCAPLPPQGHRQRSPSPENGGAM